MSNIAFIREPIIRRLRACSRISRDTYERAMWGDPTALSACAVQLKDEDRRRFAEEATP